MAKFELLICDVGTVIQITATYDLWVSDIVEATQFTPSKASDSSLEKPFAAIVAALQTQKNKILNRFTWRLLVKIYSLKRDSLLLDARFYLTLLSTSQNARAEFFKKLCLKALESVADKNFADMCRVNLAKNLSLEEISALYVDICRRERNFGARDRGMFHPTLIKRRNQADRAPAYYEYAMSTL